MHAPAVIELAEAGLPHIVYWPEAQPGSQLIAAHFGHAFCAALRNPIATVAEVLDAYTIDSCVSHLLANSCCCIGMVSLLNAKNGQDSSLTSRPCA